MEDTSSKNGIRQFFKFLLFSIGAGIVEALSFTLIHETTPKTNFFLVTAEVTSVVLSCIFNFTINRKFTFKASTNIARGMLFYGLFYLIMTPLGAGFVVFLKDIGWNEYLAKGTKMLLNFLIDFCFCKFVLFNKKFKI